MQRHHVVARNGRACRMVSFCASWIFTINTRSLPVRIRGLRSGLPITHTVSSDGCWFCTMREQESNLSACGLEPRLTAAETPCSKETSGGHVELVDSLGIEPRLNAGYEPGALPLRYESFNFMEINLVFSTPLFY